jgi:hypothetical protein
LEKINAAPPPLEPCSIHGVPDSPVWLVMRVLSGAVKVSSSRGRAMLGLAEADGPALALGLRLALGLLDGDNDVEALGLREGLGLDEGETLADGETLAEGETEGLTEADGEPATTPAWERISTNPQAVGLAVDRVKEAELTVPPALKIWSAQVIPLPSMRSVKPDGEVKVGVPSATQVAVMVDLVSVRASEGKVLVVEEAFCWASIAPIGEVWSVLR